MAVVVQTTELTRKKSCPVAAFFVKSGTVFPVLRWQFDLMEKKTNNAEPKQGKHEHPLPQEMSNNERKANAAAHTAADKDMEDDAELTASSPNDDLDEGETARLGEDTDLI